MIKLSACVLCSALSLYLAVSIGTKVFVAGELNMRVATLFEGKELRAEIFESTPAKTNHRATDRRR
jgi:hypothetical protein